MDVETDLQSKLDSGEFLPIMEDFYTIQGEGHHTGVASYFIRIGGCDVGCHWCDVKESWDASIHPVTSIDQVIAKACSQPARTVVLTGGEPGSYQLGSLTQGLKKQGFKVHLETSGAYELSGVFDWICLSPKKTVPPLPANYQRADELKVIVHNNDDIRWAIEQSGHLNPSCHLYLQPEWGKRESTMPMIIDFVKDNPKWKISLQSHKYMRIP